MFESMFISAEVCEAGVGEREDCGTAGCGVNSPLVMDEHCKGFSLPRFSLCLSVFICMLHE